MRASRRFHARIGALGATVLIAGSLAVAAAPSAYAADPTSWSNLVTAFDDPSGGTVHLGGSITFDPATDSGQLRVADGQSVTLDLHGFSLTVATNEPGTAAIGVPSGTTLTIEDTNSGVLNVTGGHGIDGNGGTGGAGIGGDADSDGGTLHVLSGTIDATGGKGGNGVKAVGDIGGGGGGAGIGGGGGDDLGGAGGGGTVSLDGGTIDAIGGGGGRGTLSLGTGSEPDGGGGAGIGGGGGYGGDSGAGTPVSGGGGATLTIGSSATVTASAASSGSNPAVPIGGGAGGGNAASGAFGSLNNAGSLTFGTGPVEVIPDGTTPSLFDNQTGATITLRTALTGPASGGAAISNDSTILTGAGGEIDDTLASGSNTLTIDGHAFDLSYHLNGATGTTPADDFVYSDDYSDAGLTAPPGPTPPSGDIFAGWNTESDGTGSFIRETTNIENAVGIGPKLVPLYAIFLPSSPTIGDWPTLVKDVAEIPPASLITVHLANDISNTTTAQLAVPTDATLTLDLAGHSLTINPGNVPSGDAGIEVPPTSALGIENSGSGGVLTVTGGTGSGLFGGGDGGAGIGGDAADASGSVSVTSGTVHATGGDGEDGEDDFPGFPADIGGGGGGSGIGGGGEANGGVATLNGSGSVTAVGGFGGGGSNDQAAGGGGAGIGGGGGSGGGVFIFGPFDATPGGDGGTTSLTSGATLTATGRDGGEPIGGGGGAIGEDSGAFGSLDNAGTITVDSALTAPTSGSAAITNDGTILAGSGGEIDDTLASSANNLTIHDHAYDVTFNVNGGSGPTPADQLVYAKDFDDAGQTLPAGPTPPGTVPFAGWFTAASGGTQVTTATSLATAAAGNGPRILPLFAQYHSPTPPAAPPAAPSSTVEVGSADNPSVVGQPVTVTASIGGPAISAARPRVPAPVTGGTAQLMVDGQNVATPQPVSNGTATFAPLTSLGVGQHDIQVLYFPAAGSATPPGGGSYTQLVEKAATTTKVIAQGGQATITVSPVAPGAGTPTGTVTLSSAGTTIATVTLSNGTGTASNLTTSSVIDAAYGGDADFTSSAGSTAAKDPIITAAVGSKHHKTKAGWYRGPVTITFTCTPGSAPLTAACPEPVTLSGNGAHQDVTRTVHANDGGIASITVTGIKIDHIAPTIHVSGVKSGHTYRHARTLRCDATDALSGVASCTIHSGSHHTPKGQRITYTATAVDKAGNISRKHGHYLVRRD